MRYLDSFNEEFFFNRKPNKSNMWISNPKPKIRIPNDFDISLRYFSHEVTNISEFRYNLEKVLNKLSIYSAGVIMVKLYGISFTKVHPDNKWLDYSETFSKLHEISNKLGYKLNKVVSLGDGRFGKIENIVNFCFYQIVNDILTQNVKTRLTLLYKIEGIGFVTIDDINLADNNIENKDIDDATIEENFYELIDDSKISLISKKDESCKIFTLTILKLITPDLLFQISECLLVASNRLKEQNIMLKIDSFSMNSITFKCYNTISKTG